MSKRVQLTPQISKNIQTALGDEGFDTSQVAVYEARFITTEPVRKGGFMNKARVSASTLHEMAAFMATSGNAVPLHIMHETDLLPVGKVFSARVMGMANGETELRGQFYIPLNEVESLKKVDTAVVDEVSINIQNKHAFCSECEFDYLGPEADFMNRYNMTCGNGHVIGEEGVHLRLVGLERWYELSLCGTGAAQGAKILPYARQVMSKETADRLAANETLEAGFLIASYKLNEGDTKMSAEFLALTDKYQAAVDAGASARAELKLATDKVTSLETENTELKSTVAAKDEEIKTLKASAPEVAQLTTDLTTAKTELKEATDKVAPHVKAALVASGVAETEIPESLVAMLALIEAKGLKLHQTIGTEGKSVEKTDATELKATEDSRKALYKTKK